MCSLHSQLTLPQSLAAAGELAVRADLAGVVFVRRRTMGGRTLHGPHLGMEISGGRNPAGGAPALRVVKERRGAWSMRWG